MNKKKSGIDTRLEIKNITEYTLKIMKYSINSCVINPKETGDFLAKYKKSKLIRTTFFSRTGRRSPKSFLKQKKDE